ncbi:MAG TPA: acyl-CoA dehydrogenase family protein [Candidatus Limnocylindria bacterium]|jgi:alkylation response protein AidB-like acyl-CoA dehydrogenase|nr:acyl-CoA dehydrogenase family protein [Candidatus Limnocylindria bacterium]
MTTTNFFTGNPDLVEVFDRAIPWARVVRAVEGPDADVDATVATWREVCELAGRYIATEIAPRAGKIDEIGVIRDGGKIRMNEPMIENLRGLAGLGLAAPSVPLDLGGAGLPFTISMMIAEMLARADLATQVQHGIGWNAPAALIHRFGTEQQKARYLPRLAKGQIMGAVAMTEPQAGSDVGRIVTTATLRQDGCWVLQGRKQFISAGQGELVIVLARCVDGSSGLDGLGMFIAEREGDNYIVERAEHKFTIRGSPTCALVFEGTLATLLGAVGDGWKQIVTFMNESRLGVGIQGIGVATAALAKASDYAAQRVQMGKPIREHPMVAEMLLDMETTVAGARALAYEAAVLQDEALFAKDERAARDVRELTPLVKWYGTEGAVRVCRLALQVHGGVGVVDEYDVGRYMRDSLITPIYEGTSQIQSLMAVKDLMKWTMRRPASLLGGGPSAVLARARFDGRIGADFAAARGHVVGSLRSLVGRLVRRKGPGLLRGGTELSEQDLGPILLHAERLTEALAHTHVARVLAERARRVPERRSLAARAARTARLVAERNRRAISLDDGSVFERIADWQAERR